MNKYSAFCLRVLRVLYCRKLKTREAPGSGITWKKVGPAQMLGALIASRRPCMVARFGSVELSTMVAWYESTVRHRPCLDYIRGLAPFPQKWSDERVKSICIGPGFFPQDKELCARFCEMMLRDIPELDVLGSWMRYEELFDHLHHAQKIHLCNLEPFDDSGDPWSRHLEGRKVLVIHPFASTIEKQYREKRELLFADKRVLPPFELKTIKAVQSMGGNPPPGFGTWFDAFDWMKAQMDATDYDVCLLGCGAYGFPLAAHAKRQGKQAVHLGGALQLLFGIKGKRWTEQFGTDPAKNPYLKLFNEHWVFPDASEKPKIASAVEDGCYW